MYHMKNIITFEEEIVLPKCMYSIKNPIEVSEKDNEINISKQKMPKNQLHDLEERQDKLLHKLDVLYERIKSISSLCTLNNHQELKTRNVNNVNPEEVVIVLSPDNLPWFLNIFVKNTEALNVSWHIHSSVPQTKVAKIEAFFRKFQDLYKLKTDIKVNLRLIFKSDSAAPELKTSTLGVPVSGIVNILRYLCLTYFYVVSYNYNNYEVDGLLDLCHKIELASDKNKEVLIPKLFVNSKKWIHNNELSIVDLAVFNIIKQLQNGNKYVSKQWLNECEKIIL